MFRGCTCGRRLLAKENAADVLLRLNPISRDAIYKAVEVEHAKLLRAPMRA